MMLGIVIKLLDQRSYSHMFYSQIITDDVGDILMTIPNIVCDDLTVKHVTVTSLV
jgi:hypothetical protein